MSDLIDIDARGLRCPLPVLRAQKALRAMRPGARLRIRTDDPMALIDMPHFCAEAGHQLLAQAEQPDGHLFEIRRGPGLRCA